MLLSGVHTCSQVNMQCASGARESAVLKLLIEHVSPDVLMQPCWLAGWLSTCMKAMLDLCLVYQTEALFATTVVCQAWT